VDEFALRSGRHRILLDGVYDPRHSSDITVRLTDVDLETLRSLGLVPIGGRLDGWVRLQGPQSAQTIEARLGLGLRGKDGKNIGHIRTDLAMTPEEFRIDAAAVPLRGGRLTVSGTVPRRNGADTLALRVRADSFALGVLDPLLPPDAARDLGGTLLAQARVGGTLAAPTASGSLQITSARVTVPALDLSYRGELSARLSGDELRIDRLQLRTDKKERLTAAGAVRLRPLTNPALGVTAKLDQFHVSNTAQLDATASGEIHLQGTVQRPSLTGTLTMGRTDLTVGGGEAAANVEQVELTPEDLRQVARRFGPAVLAQAHDSPGLVDRFHLDLNLDLPRRVWFRRHASPKAEIELSGRVRLTQQPGQPMQFFGRVSPVPGRSSLDVYGREFRLTGGDIRLAGPVDSTLLNITADYQVPTQGGPEDQRVVISMAAKGHPDSLSLEFMGDPEMSQDDMLSYIVTGRPASDNPLATRSAGGEGAGAMGAEVALSGLTQSLSASAEKELGLDVFQIRQEGLRGLTLTAGRYIGSSLFLSMHLPIELGSDLQQVPGTNLGPSFELEYAARRWLWADVQGGNVAPRFTLRTRYAY
jgi:translocation and assembly module TamB